MSNYHGGHKARRYFEGWYLKHQRGDETLAFIPGVSFDEKGGRSAFVQVVTNRDSYSVSYPFSEFLAQRDQFVVQAGSNVFTQRGVHIDMKGKDLRTSGTVHYGSFTPAKSDVMGPFNRLPFMECRHGVLSLYHRIWGELTINGRVIDLNNGVGYIEKDWGRSFPERYVWAQHGGFDAGPCCVTASVADIPFWGLKFTGCIAVVYYRGREYRLATYNGARVLQWGEDGLDILRGPYRLRVELIKKAGQPLLAPRSGEMKRTIYEEASGDARFVFAVEDRPLFDVKTDRASFEFSQ